MAIIEVNKDNFREEVLESREPVLVDFNADWCGPCRMLRPVLEEVADENDRIKIVSVNIDEANELSEKYEIFSIPCLVLFKDGKEIRREVGILSRDEIMEIIGEK